MEDLDGILNSGEVPNLFEPDEKAEVMEVPQKLAVFVAVAVLVDVAVDVFFDVFVDVFFDVLVEVLVAVAVVYVFVVVTADHHNCTSH